MVVHINVPLSIAMKMMLKLSAVLFSLLLSCPLWAQQNFDSLVPSTLEKAGSNRAELEKAIESVEPEMKRGLQFLLAYMPDSDAKSLDAEFLLSHVRGAYASWNESPWKDQIDEPTFLNYILPYANVSERREPWRSDFRKRFLPLVKSAKTTSEAAVILNQNIFSKLDLKYSTKRKRADQGPYESIESGLASCTGLSIVLINACRSVGVPARFVGTPRWSDNSGNHSWVEIWDGEWKFTGAAEPTGDDLNMGWFTDRAATAIESEPNYAIHAVSYRKTNLKFPLIWKRDFDPVWSVNVTSRYLAKRDAGDNEVLLRFKVVDSASGERVVAKLQIIGSDNQAIFEGQTKDERFDTNDHLKIALPKNAKLVARYRVGERELSSEFHTGEQTKLVSLETAANPQEQTESISIDKAKKLVDKIWNAKKAELIEARREEMKAKLIKLDAYPDLKMKYEIKTFGEKPKAGHALFISMHGGGGAPAKVNERQWKNQIRLYEPAEGIYLAPRAPTDTWNLWHQEHIDAFFDRIIENFVASGEVDPNRVYLLGYSAGGDGVYQLAPRMADRFAAASMMAGHPNETKPLGFRNIPFAIYMGGKDAAYKRNKIAAQWKDDLAKLQKQDAGGYEHQVTIYPDKGHWMEREDASAIPWMASKIRNVWPKKIVWHQDDVTHDRSYWLSVPDGKAKQRTTIVASVDGQKITIDSKDVGQIRIWLSDLLLDLDAEIELVVNGKSKTRKVSRSENALRLSLQSRFDKAMMAPAFIDVVIE